MRIPVPVSVKASASVAAYALAALVAALVSQYGFGLPPCELCIYQRWPYVAVALLGVLGCWRVRSVGALKLLLLMAAALFVLDAGIAGYHVGVEKGVFEGLESCGAGGFASGASLEEMRQQLLAAPVVSCKDPMFVLLGLSMAGWNLLYALGGVLLCVVWMRYETRARAAG